MVQFQEEPAEGLHLILQGSWQNSLETDLHQSSHIGRLAIQSMYEMAAVHNPHRGPFDHRSTIYREWWSRSILLKAARWIRPEAKPGHIQIAEDRRTERDASVLSSLITNKRPVYQVLGEQKVNGLNVLVGGMERYFHSPVTVIYVSSIRQLTHTGHLRRWKASSSCGLYLTTQRLIVAWSTLCTFMYANARRVYLKSPPIKLATNFPILIKNIQFTVLS
jgi:hypothetical protein